MLAWDWHNFSLFTSAELGFSACWKEDASRSVHAEIYKWRKQPNTRFLACLMQATGMHSSNQSYPK
jgi:hypothetical protein